MSGDSSDKVKEKKPKRTKKKWQKYKPIKLESFADYLFDDKAAKMPIVHRGSKREIDKPSIVDELR